MIWFLKYWQPLTAALLTAVVSFGISSAFSKLSDKIHDSEMQRLKTYMTLQCTSDKNLTKEVSHALQTQLADRNNQLANLKRVYASQCVPVARAAARHDAATGDAKFPRQDGLNSTTLLDFAGDAEKTGLKLDACQDFIRKTWAAKEQ